MDSKIIIRNVNEAYVGIVCEDGVAYELRENFTFQVPGYQFTPQYKARLWDGKIRLFDIRTKQLYRGLVPYIAKFCEERNYEWDYDTIKTEYLKIKKDFRKIKRHEHTSSNDESVEV